MIAYLKDSLHWLYLFCFKVDVYMRVTEKLSPGQAVAHSLIVAPWLWLGGLILLCGIGLTSEVAGYDFHWQRAFIIFAQAGLFSWLISTLVWGAPGGLVFGLFIGLLGGLTVGWGGRQVFGQFIEPYVRMGGGMGGGLVFGLLFGLHGWLVGGLVFGPVLGLVSGLQGWWSDALRFVAVFLPVMLGSFTLLHGRPYYWPVYLRQLWLARSDGSWLTHFRQSPVHWDKNIGAPLPWLSEWLFEIVKADRKEGVSEVLWVAAERPFQRKAAQKALLKLAIFDLTQFHAIPDLCQAVTALDFLPSDLGPAGLSQARPHLNKITASATDYLKRQTPIGQHKALLELQQAVGRFAKAMALAPAPTGPELQRVATQWLRFINAAETELRARLPFENPFIAGRPVHEDEGQFKGRHGLVVKIEEAIFGQRPSLLLYGRRRTGKTSTLFNLPRLMSSQFVPVFIDCQNQRFNDSDAMFCYHLTRALHDELVKRKQAEGLAQPTKSEFEQHAFTRLDEFLDELEAHSRRIGKQMLLTFDEYERLEEGIRDGKLTRAVLNQIRAIVQHRERLIVLFSGSHRFEELQTVNWSDYLINVQTLHLSFLTRDEARELIEHPTPEFALGYAPGVVDRVLDLTHGQPFLVQALGSELVNLINREKRKEATLADLDVAIDRVLGMADAYFENNWRDCNEAEQAVLRALATQQVDGLAAAERQRALLGLSRKELVEQRDSQWQFTIELFRLWVKREKTTAEMALSAA